MCWWGIRSAEAAGRHRAGLRARERAVCHVTELLLDAQADQHGHGHERHQGVEVGIAPRQGFEPQLEVVVDGLQFGTQIDQALQ